MSLQAQQHSQRTFDIERQNSYDQAWGCMFQKLVEYKETNGDCNVSGHNTKLGGWVARQRMCLRMGKMRHDQVERLNDIGFEWRRLKALPSMTDAQFETMLLVTEEYIKFQGGRGWIPHSTPLVPKVGNWAHDVRTRKTQGMLSTRRQLALENIGFVWQEQLSIPPRSYKTFDEMLQIAADYIRGVDGNGWVPMLTPEFPKLGKWAQVQRNQKRAGTLSESRQKALESIGFQWEAKSSPHCDDEEFAVMLQETAEYIRVRGRGWVPARILKDPKLGNWAETKRRQKRAGRLSASRQKALESIGFEWEPKKTKNSSLRGYRVEFAAMLETTAEYIRVQGHGWVPKRTQVEDRNIGNWAGTQRQHKRAGKLSESRQKALESIGFVWEPPVLTNFEEMLQAAAEHIRVQGHGWVVKQTPEFPKLGMWAQSQRQEKRKGKLSTSRQLALDNIGFVWNAPSTPFDGFEAMLKATAEYIRVQGHGWVQSQPPEFPKIGKWAQVQRDKKRAGKLSTSRQLALDNIGFVWNAPSRTRLVSEFEAKLEATAEYIKVQGNGWVPSLTPGFPRVGTWARGWRHQKRTGELSTARQLALDNIGFIWEKPEQMPTLDNAGAKFEAMLQAAEHIRVQASV